MNVMKIFTNGGLKNYRTVVEWYVGLWRTDSVEATESVDDGEPFDTKYPSLSPHDASISPLLMKKDTATPGLEQRPPVANGTLSAQPNR